MESEFEPFSKLWIAFSSFLARVSNNNDNYLNDLVNQTNKNANVNDQTLYKKIKRFLLEPSIQEQIVNPLEASQNMDVIEIVDLIQKNFKEVVCNIRICLIKADSNWWNSFMSDYSISYGGKVLLEHSPQDFLDLISELYENLKDINNSVNWVKASILCSLIRELLRQIVYISSGCKQNQVLLDLLPGSNISLIRALGTQYAWFSFNLERINLNSSLSIVSQLVNNEERIYSLAKWVYNLRILSNQNRHQETAIQEILRKTIFNHIFQYWQSDFSQLGILHTIINRLSGPKEGD